MRRTGLLCALVAIAFLSGCADCDGPSVAGVTTELRAESAEVDFGSTYVGLAVTRDVHVRNTSTAGVRIRSVELSASDAFVLETHAPITVGGGSTVGLVVRFTPAAAGAYDATLTVESDAEIGKTLTIALRGTALLPPICEDNDVCTSDAFDVSANQCRFTQLTGSCNDGSECTQQDRCIDGACVGVARRCDDGNVCTLDLCDATRGCDHPLDPTRCEDDDPCTVDVCDPATGGCSHRNAPDGTSCGPIDGCRGVSLCVAGRCRQLPVPDGFPCSDGDVCSTGDHCAGGVCVADRPSETPVIGTLLTRSGGPGAAAIFLSPTRLLIADAPVLTVAELANGTLTTASRLVLEGVAPGATVLARMGDGRVLVGVRAVEASGPPQRLLVYRALDDGRLELLAEGRGDAPTSGPYGRVLATRLLAMGDVVLACGAALEAYDLAGGGATITPFALALGTSGAGEWTCDGLWLSASGVLQVLLVDDVGARALAQVDVTSPAHPVLLSMDTDPAWRSVLSVRNGWMVRAATSGWEVVDVASGTLLGAHAYTEPVRSGGTCVSGQAVFLLRGRGDVVPTWQLEAYERAETGQFALVGSREVFAGFGWPNARIRCEDGLVIVSSPDRSLLLDARTPADLRLLSGGDDGPMAVVRVVDGRAYAMGRSGVYPASSTGGVWAWDTPRPVHQRLDVARVSAATDVHVGPSVIPLPRPAAQVNVWDVSDPAAPRLATSAARSDAWLRSTPRALLSFSDQVQRVSRLPLGPRWPPPATLASDAEWTTTFPNDGLHADSLVVSKDGSRVVRLRGSSSGLTRLAVASLDDGGFTPLGEGSVGNGASVLDARAAGDALVTLQQVGTGAETNDRVLMLHAIDPATNTISNGAQLRVGPVLRILGFDGRTAILGLADRIRFVQAGGNTLAIAGDVRTPQEVWDVDFVEDSLLAVSSNTLAVVTPPCPHVR